MKIFFKMFRTCSTFDTNVCEMMTIDVELFCNFVISALQHVIIEDGVMDFLNVTFVLMNVIVTTFLTLHAMIAVSYLDCECMYY